MIFTEEHLDMIDTTLAISCSELVMSERRKDRMSSGGDRMGSTKDSRSTV